MGKIAIITDSVACLPQELAQQYQIHIVPAGNIYFEGKLYRDWIDLNHSEAYSMLETAPDKFFTGAATPLEFLRIFKDLSQWADAIVYIALSSKLSTLHNMARNARELAKEQLPQTIIKIIDSRTATAAQGFIALAAARAAQENKNLSEVVEAAEKVKRKVDLYYIMETIRYVYRTGRIPRAVSNIGSRLKVKPLVTIRRGSAHVLGISTNKCKGLDRLIQAARSKIKHQPVHLAVLHAGNPDEAENLKQQMTAEFNCIEVWTGQFSPLMAYATGRGVIGIAFYTDS
ncbi:DegV family protein [Chloroflexota bacterium]